MGITRDLHYYPIGVCVKTPLLELYFRNTFQRNCLPTLSQIAMHLNVLEIRRKTEKRGEKKKIIAV